MQCEHEVRSKILEKIDLLRIVYDVRDSCKYICPVVSLSKSKDCFARSAVLRFLTLDTVTRLLRHKYLTPSSIPLPTVTGAIKERLNSTP